MSTKVLKTYCLNKRNGGFKGKMRKFSYFLTYFCRESLHLFFSNKNRY